MSFYWYIDGVRYPHAPDLVREGRKANKTSEVSKTKPIGESTYQLPRSSHYQEKSTQYKPTKTQATASDIMSSPVFTLPDSTPLIEIWKTIQNHRFRHIPIFSENKLLVGIVSDRDLLQYAYQHITQKTSLDKIQVKQFMKKNLLTISPDTPLADIADIIISYQLGSLLVTEENMTLSGIITRSDILRIIAQHKTLNQWA